MPTKSEVAEAYAKIEIAYREALNQGLAAWRTEESKRRGCSAAQRAAIQCHEQYGGNFKTWETRVRSFLLSLDEDEYSAIIPETVKRATAAGIIHPELPDGKIDTTHLVEHLKRRFAKEREREQAKRWRKIHIRESGPFAVAFMGDPHVDNHGCNWALLERDIKIIRDTRGMYAANAGDSIDNWTGRLAALKGKNPVTDSEAYQLCEWFIKQLAEKWVLFVLGNHDAWGEGSRIFQHITGDVIDCDDWQAQVRLVAANGAEFPVWLAHSFKGNSIYNKVHGALRQARFSGAACLYVQGHHHEWAIMQEEDADKGLVHTVCKARGYKFNDEYANVHGFAEQQLGASIVAVFDPDAQNAAQAVKVFADIEEGAEFLTWKRSRGRHTVVKSTRSATNFR
jgi:hypothetical protein